MTANSSQSTGTTAEAIRRARYRLRATATSTIARTAWRLSATARTPTHCDDDPGRRAGHHRVVPQHVYRAADQHQRHRRRGRRRQPDKQRHGQRRKPGRAGAAVNATTTVSNSTDGRLRRPRCPVRGRRHRGQHPRRRRRLQCHHESDRSGHRDRRPRLGRDRRQRQSARPGPDGHGRQRHRNRQRLQPRHEECLQRDHDGQLRCRVGHRPGRQAQRHQRRRGCPGRPETQCPGQRHSDLEGARCHDHGDHRAESDLHVHRRGGLRRRASRRAR